MAEPHRQKKATPPNASRTSPVAPGTELVEIARLKEYPFLKDCSDIVLRKLQPQFAERRFEPGATILCAAATATPPTTWRRASSASASRRSGDAARSKAAEAAARRHRWRTRIQGDFRIRNAGRSRRCSAPRVAADGTIILSDMPVDLRANEEVLLEPGEVFGEMSALSRYPISSRRHRAERRRSAC